MQYFSDVVQDRNGNVIGAASVLVQNYPSLSTATIYDSAGVAATNPVAADSDGGYSFYAPPGAYTLVISKSGITTKTVSNKIIGAGATDFLQSGTGAVSRTVQSKERDWVSIDDFGADPAGTAAANVTAIQSALNTGKNITTNAARGTYNINAALTVTTANQQIDLRDCVLNLNDATGLLNHIIVGDNITQLNGVTITQVSFTRTQVATAGAAIKAQYVGLFDVSECRVYGNSFIFQGINVSRGTYVRIRNNRIEHLVDRAMYFSGTGTGINKCIQVEIFNNDISYTGNVGIETNDFCEGFYIYDNIMYSCAVANVLLGATSDANGLISFKISRNDFDTGAIGCYIEHVSNLQINDNWFSNNSSNNVRLRPTVVGCTIADNQLYNSAANNIYVESTDTVITGNYISGGLSGVAFESTATRCEITGNLIQNMTAYGVNCLNVPTKIDIGPNLFNNNTTADVSTGVTSPTIASASPLALPVSSSIFNISGVTGFSALSGGFAGREVTLIFAGILTITHTIGAVVTNIALQGAANFTTAANNTLTLQHNGVQWFEKGRKT